MAALEAHIDERRAAWDKKQTNQAAIVAHFLREEIDWAGLDEDDMYTIYRALGEQGPTTYRSMLQNAYTREKFFLGMEDGKYILSIPGEKFAQNAKGKKA